MVTEDFPRRIQEHRAELTKFAKEVGRFLYKLLFRSLNKNSMSPVI